MNKIIVSGVVSLGVSLGAFAQAGALSGSGQPFPCSGTYSSTVSITTPQTYSGDASSEIIFVESDNTVVNAGAGDDCVVVNGNYNTVNAGDGNDIVYSDGVHNSLNGDKGDDRLYANAGSGTLNGAQGKDYCYLSAGSATAKQCETVATPFGTTSKRN